MNTPIESKQSTQLLGVPLTKDISNKSIASTVHKFYGKVNSVLYDFKNVPCHVKSKLLLNRTVRVKQLRAKYDGYASFVLYVPKYLKNKIIDKSFWETDSIYVREFVQKSRF